MAAPRRFVVIVSCATIVLAVALVVADRHRSTPQDPSKVVALSPVRFASEDEIRDRDIVFYEKRAAEDTASAVDRATLAALYLQRARSTGGFSDFARAEAAARYSLSRRTEHNAHTFQLLAAALLARHAFAEARDVARQADSLFPDLASLLALRGEIELELGNYASADSIFRRVRYDGEQLAVGARIARWKELTGHAEAARQVLRACIGRMTTRDDLPREQLAWFHYRLGEIDTRLGHLAEADSVYRRGLALFPADYRILGGLAQLHLRKGDWRSAVDFGEQAIAIQLDPTVLGVVSDAYRALGDSSMAQQYADAMKASALEQPGAIHRAWGLFVLDHGTARERAMVLARAQSEVKTRRDVYGYDLLAWSLYKSGRIDEARAAMAVALAQHTEDPLLEAHAAAIGVAGSLPPTARDQSARSDFAGSTRTARQAGKSVAAPAEATRTATAIANAAGSSGFNP